MHFFEMLKYSLLPQFNYYYYHHHYYQGHREFPFGNSREFPGICHHKIPDGNSREFLHIASLIFFLLESALCNLADPGLLLELLQYRTSNSIIKLPSGRRSPHRHIIIHDVYGSPTTNCLLTVCHIFHFRQSY